MSRTVCDTAAPDVRSPHGAVDANSPGPPTVGQLIQPPTTVERAAHLAAAAHLLERSHTNALVVTTGVTRGLLAVVIDAEISRAVVAGLDPGDTGVNHVSRTRPLTVRADPESTP